MTLWLHAVVIVVELGLVGASAEYARRAQSCAMDARYEAEFAYRCAKGMRAAARYCYEAAAHFEAQTGVPAPAVLRAAWDAAGIGNISRKPPGAPTDGRPKTPA